MTERPKQRQATVWGLVAIILWGMLAVLTKIGGEIPPFQMTAMTFMVAFLAGTVLFIKQGAPFSALKQPLSVWLTGVLGLFGYHACYFMAMQFAPAIEVSLIAYLWPVLIVLFSSLLPGERLCWFHLCGVGLGFTGVAVLLQKDGLFQPASNHAGGYLLAFACALVWSSYSVLSRKQKQAPTIMIGAYCGITAILSFILHLIFEKTVDPGSTGWMVILLLGLGPVGLAFFTWDYGVKNGNIQILGVLSYCAPLISSFMLVWAGLAELSWRMLAACLMIVCGSLVAVLDRLGWLKNAC